VGGGHINLLPWGVRREACGVRREASGWTGVTLWTQFLQDRWSPGVHWACIWKLTWCSFAHMFFFFNFSLFWPFGSLSNLVIFRHNCYRWGSLCGHSFSKTIGHLVYIWHPSESWHDVVVHLFLYCSILAFLEPFELGRFYEKPGKTGVTLWTQFLQDRWPCGFYWACIWKLTWCSCAPICFFFILAFFGLSGAFWT